MRKLLAETCPVRFQFRLIACLVAAVLLVCFLVIGTRNDYIPLGPLRGTPQLKNTGFHWAQRKQDYPVTSFEPVPQPELTALPRIQYEAFPVESETERNIRISRQAAIKAVMKHCWDGYKQHAWLRDEVLPLTGGTRAKVGNWGATLVDSIDMLWLMDMKAEYDDAVKTALSIDFTSSTEDYVSVFEANIRYLGSFLSAYDLTGDKRLLNKAVEVADTIYAAFDTPNRIPVPLLFMQKVKDGEKQEALNKTGLAGIGTLSLEFTRLAQLTNNAKYYDAISRIMKPLAAFQNTTNLPGMWPTSFNGQTLDFTSVRNFYTFGGDSDSMYEYLIKMYILLGGSETYGSMYRTAMNTAINHLLFRPMLPNDPDVLIAGHIEADAHGATQLKPELDHLSCFTGGMFALGSKVFNNSTHLDIARKLTDGCIVAYNSTTLGMMLEESFYIPCNSTSDCTWSEKTWLSQIKDAGDTPEERARSENMPPGITFIQSSEYILRPEAVESIFVLYRTTGEPSLRETAWSMFQKIKQHTTTEIANAAITDVMNSTAPKKDEMESFFLAETLKYFFLIFETPDVVSLDEWVFNTEAHPFRRPR